MAEDTIYRYQPDWLDWNDVDQVRKWVNIPFIHLSEGEAARTTLSYAVKNSSSAEVIELLVKHGADLDARDSDGRTPLMHAASCSKNADIIERLIHLGADLKAEDNHGMTPLACAVSYNENCDVAERFLRLFANSFPFDGQNATTDCCRPKEYGGYYLPDGGCVTWFSPEMEERGEDLSVEEVLQLTSVAWHLEKRDKSGKTLLMYAAENNQNPDIIEMLINYGADPDAGTGVYHWDECNGNYLVGNGLTPLMYAIKSNPNPDVIERLVKFGVNVNDPIYDTYGYGEIPLIYAAENSANPDIIEILVKLGADLNARTIGYGHSDYEVPALHYASLEAAKMLIKLGTDPDVRDIANGTALMEKARIGECEIVEMLLKAGADVNAQANGGMTPLMYAANADIVDLLIKHGADFNMRDTEGLTALGHALGRSANFDAIGQLFSLGFSSEMIDDVKKKKEKEANKEAKMGADRKELMEELRDEEIERMNAVKKTEEGRAKAAILRAEREAV